MGTLLKGAAQRANDNYGEAVPFVATGNGGFRPSSKYWGRHSSGIYQGMPCVFHSLSPLDSIQSVQLCRII